MATNYEITRNQMRGEFVKYDQDNMIRKFSLRNDASYIYINFMSREYRIDRKTGVVEWSENDFSTSVEADFNESMTIYDILCYSRDDCSLSGNFCPVNLLKGTVKTSGSGSNLFQNAADSFSGKQKELECVCSFLGEDPGLKGDVAVKLYPFPFLPVILQFWEADDDFPARLNFLFDENTLDYMHFETVFFMTGHILKRIGEMMRSNAL